MDDRTSQEATPSRAAAAPTTSSSPSFDPRDLIPTPLFCASPEGRLAWMNAAAEQLTGRHAAAVAGEPFSVLFPEEARMKVARHMLRQRRRGVTDYYVEAPIVTGGLEPHWVGLHVRLATAANGRTAYVCAAHDLHEIHENLEVLKRRNRELAARLDEATAGAELKSTFLATMSHELRAPMNGVIGMSRLLLDSNLDRDQRTWAEVIQGSGDQLLELVDDILDYSRIESGQLTIGSMDFDLRVTVDAVASLLSTRAAGANVSFSSLVHHRVPSFVNGDPGRLRQVLLHLAECALDEAEGGEIQVRVELVEETAHQAVLRFWVNRIGGPVGGTPEAEEALLAVYGGAASVEGGVAQRLGGRALGLTISRRLVTLMGGDAGASRVEGMGSKLWFRVPLGKQIERPATVPAAGGSRSDVTTVRALVVDADTANRALLRDAIASWGGTCDTAEGGLDAVERLKAAAGLGAPYGAVLVDLDVSEVDAETFARSVRDDASLAGLALVLVTSLGRPGDAARAESWGYDAYFVTPVDASELRGALVELLGRDRAAGNTRLVTRHTVAELKKRRVRVLVVEDNAIDQLVIASALRRVGYTPEMVGSVDDAAAALARQPADVVFVDVASAGDDGFERAGALRAACDAASHGARTPIVALVGRVRDEEKARCTEVGIDDLLGKPVDLEALVATVGRWVEAREEAPADVAVAEPSPASEPVAEVEAAAEPVAEATPEFVIESVEETPPVAPEAEPIVEATSEIVVEAPVSSAEPVAETVVEMQTEDAPVAAAEPEVVAEAPPEAPVEAVAVSPLDGLPVLDASCLETASMGNAEIRDLLVDAFLTRTRQPLDRLKKAAEWNDGRAVEFQAHAMKGMCQSVGAARCAAVLGTVEEHAAAGRLEEAVAGVIQVEAELIAVRETWRAWGRAAEGPDAGEIARAA